MNAKKAVVYSMLATSVVMVAAEKRLPEPRVFIGGAIVYFGLGAVAEVAPQVATSMALLLFVGTLLYQGDKAFATLQKKTRKTTGRKRRPGRTQGINAAERRTGNE